MYHFDPATGVLTLQGKWSAGEFRALVAKLGVANIKKIVLDAYAYLSVKDMDLSFTEIEVPRTGYLTVAHGILRNVKIDGVARIRYSTIDEVENDGQLYMTCRSRGRSIKNLRHLNLSQSFVLGLHCGPHSSVKATSSYICNSTASSTASLCLGPSMVIGGTGSLAFWSRPTLGATGFSRFTPEMQLRIMVIEVLCTVDYIDSGFNWTAAPRLYRLAVEIAKYLMNNVSLSWDLAREFNSRIVFPDKIMRGKRLVAFNTQPAVDTLAKYVGLFNV